MHFSLHKIKCAFDHPKSNIYIFFLKMQLCLITRVVEYLVTESAPRGGVPFRLRTTKLNHSLTMFTQKFYEAIKGFQFYFARGVVYGEESSKLS